MLIPRAEASQIWPNLEMRMTHLQVNVEYIGDMQIRLTPTGERNGAGKHGIIAVENGRDRPPLVMKLEKC